MRKRWNVCSSIRNMKGRIGEQSVKRWRMNGWDDVHSKAQKIWASLALRGPGSLLGAQKTDSQINVFSRIKREPSLTRFREIRRQRDLGQRNGLHHHHPRPLRRIFWSRILWASWISGDASQYAQLIPMRHHITLAFLLWLTETTLAGQGLLLWGGENQPHIKQ